MEENKGEQYRENELYQDGYTLAEIPCPDCGAWVWVKDETVYLGQFDEDGIGQHAEECASCGWGTVTYED